MEDLLHRLNQFAIRNGIDAIGAVPINERGLAGREGEGADTATTLGLVAQQVLPSARSVVIIAYSYYDDRPSDLSRPGYPHGVVSRAYWRDHMMELRAKAQDLAACLCQSGAEAAVVEGLPLRDLAVQAGIGTIGKNSLLQSYDHGSWVLLASVLTDLESPAAEAGGCRCGSCQACVRLCPTQAIQRPFSVDRERCIGHILSSPDEIPIDVRARIGNRVFSCDMCQEVCPRNKFVQPARSGLPESCSGSARSPDLKLLLTMSEEDRRQLLPWLGMGDSDDYLIRRNAVIAMGNSGDPAMEPLLKEVLLRPEPQLRGYSAWALGHLKAASAINAIEEALSIEQDEFAKAEMSSALVQLQEKEE